MNVDIEEARRLAVETKGYAYGYQVLGSLYFNKTDSESIDDLMDDYDEILFSESYEKIWEELSASEKELVKIIVDNKRREDILPLMESPQNYSVFRNSLIKGGIIAEAGRGNVEFSLPHFEEYIRYYCM